MANRRFRLSGLLTRGVSRVLVVAIALMPASAWAADDRSARGTGALSPLSIDTEPPGAAVYVDGKFQGETPMNVAVAPGDHRIRLVKSGFLENARIVNVPSGRASNVTVKLTRPVVSTAATEQVTGGGGGGGGFGNKWLWIGLAGAGAGAAVFLLSGGNKPPSAGSASVSPTGTGMAGLTSFTFNSTASDSDGDALTYNWNFGDGTTGSGASPTKTYNNPGTFQVTATVSDGKESASSAPISVTVANNLSGTWSGGSIPGIPNVNCTSSVTLTHTSGGLSGTMSLTGPCVGSFPLSSASASTPLVHPNTVNWQSSVFNFTVGSTVYPNLAVRFSGPTNAAGTSKTGTVTMLQSGTTVTTANTTYSR